MKNRLVFSVVVVLLVLFSAAAFYYVWQEKKPRSTAPMLEQAP